MSIDPYEQHNRAQTEREICKNAVYYLNEWHDNMMKSMPFDVYPLWTVIKEGGPHHARKDSYQSILSGWNQQEEAGLLKN